ncbi:MAG: right-handed parallel beta-helix repeat-containing protein [Anaerolineae bacterium]|nr:right-handed parallel beta-helix repeat-containing protein [Anaerolineae bacterium]
MRNRVMIVLVTLCMLATPWLLTPQTVLADTLVVTNTQDSDEGSLRQAILDAEGRVGPDTIVFNIPESDPGYNEVLGVWTIQPLSELPEILYGETTIDGSSQADFIGQDTNPSGPEIEINGTSTGLVAVGFRISSSDNTIANLLINNFSGVLSSGAIVIDGGGANRNVIRGCYIGTDPTGTEARRNIAGVAILHGAQHNTIGGTVAGEGNLISANQGSLSSFGVWIQGEDSDNNIITGNYIGTDISGTVALGNAQSGVCIEQGAGSNVVTNNLISGNRTYGVLLKDEGTNNNLVSGNCIGLASDGIAALGNRYSGIVIKNGSQHNIVGGIGLESRNIISSNGDYGVYISGSDTAHHYVEGNYIGTNREGVLNRGNGKAGVYITGGAHHNTVGRSSAGRNVISGNESHGIWLSSETAHNTIRGNLIGTDVSGTLSLGNKGDGIRLENRSHSNTVGGEPHADANVISSNRGSGVRISGTNTVNNAIVGNYIGTDLIGKLTLGNTSYGVYMGLGASDNAIGPGNSITHNGAPGVYIYLETTLRNTITRNSIVGNGQKGISIIFVAQPDPPTPTVTGGSGNYVEGEALPGTTVEVFSGPDDEGMYYEGTAIAGQDGTFRIEAQIRGRYATATATDAVGTTSEFSEEYEVQPLWRILHIPIIVNSYHASGS